MLQKVVTSDIITILSNKKQSSNRVIFFILDTIIQGLKMREKHGESTMEAHQRLSSSGLNVNEEGLIVPKKLHNPCLESRTVRDLNHEIRWNARV